MSRTTPGAATTLDSIKRSLVGLCMPLALEVRVSPTTVQKWRKRTSTADAQMGPKEPRSTVLTVEEKAIVVAFRRHTLLPLDDCLYALQPTIPHLERCPIGLNRLGFESGGDVIRYLSFPGGEPDALSPVSGSA